jgi:trans-2-enoyl-CoA reductase
MYDYMEVDFNDKQNLIDAMKHYESLSESCTTNAFMALGKPVTREIQDHVAHLRQAHTYALALIKLMEHEAAEKSPTKKSLSKRLFRK